MGYKNDQLKLTLGCYSLNFMDRLLYEAQEQPSKMLLKEVVLNDESNHDLLI
jgi:hypothetical protein